MKINLKTLLINEQNNFIKVSIYIFGGFSIVLARYNVGRLVVMIMFWSRQSIVIPTVKKEGQITKNYLLFFNLSSI
ncbi:hypothetical protein Q5O89_00975 [Peribacillus frigoritolerans]|nr:hypothetical protein [Peribacillus frigoritolerans]